MHRRVMWVIAGLMILQLGTGCCRWRNYRMSRIQEREHIVAPALSSCSTCDASPITGIAAYPAASPGTVVVPGPIAAPSLGSPAPAEAPVRMPTLSSRPLLGAPVGLRR